MPDVLSLLVGRTLPSARADGSTVSERGGRGGERYGIPLLSPLQGLADEGSLFVATNPTPGTGIAPNAVETSFSDTRGFFVFGNTDAAGGKRIFLHWLRLILLGTAPTSVVSQNFAIKRSSSSREPTTAANRTLLTAVQMASGSGRGSIARMMSYANAGAMTVPASASGDPVIARATLPTGLGIAGDEYVLAFGGEPGHGASRGGAAVRATDPGRIVAHLPPVILEPGEWAVLHRWALTEATNAPTFEFELGWSER